MGLSRRGFAKMAGMTALAARAGLLRAELPKAAGSRVQPSRLAFIGAMGVAPGVHVYAVDGERWQLRQIVSSEAPVSLALHPSGRSLYVLNEVSEYRGLPCGSIEAYGVDTATGELGLLGREGLSLSATMPRHLTVAPDGSAVVVAVHGGGAYNRLPILADGRLGRVGGIVKETGCGPVADHQKTAHPQTVLFDSTGKRVIAADLGCDRLSVLSLDDGLAVLARHEATAGSGPRHMTLHPAGRLLYVGHALDGSLACFAYDASAGKITEQLWHVHGEFGDALAMHPAGDFLYAAGGDMVTAWRIEPVTGALNVVHSQRVGSLGTIDGMTVRSDGHRLLMVTAQGIVGMDVDAVSGRLGEAGLAVPVQRARYIAML